MKFFFCKKQFVVLCCALGITTFSVVQAQEWKPVGDRIMTPWAEKIDPANVLPEYPRPQMVRDDNWKNLNGLWNYAITQKDAAKPTTYQGKILVPFAIESALSGVGKTVGDTCSLWYQTQFKASAGKNKRTLLHFGAVDWRAEIFVNGKKIGTHEGGFTPFTFDITDYLKKGNQDLVVKVWDPTDAGPQPRGKQVRWPEGIWYTPVTGIWQTVWLETVPESYVASTVQTPDLNDESLAFSAQVKNAKPGDIVKVSAWDGNTKITELEIEPNESVSLKIKNPKLWSPDSPFLYDLKVGLIRNGKQIDNIDSYFAMRAISMAKDANGVQRMMLNNKFEFQYGPLDQGWWPDGLYTAPTDEALKFDIEKTKEMGFNMIRKHIKVEPARWYNYCDKMGILVWQDMPSGDGANGWESRIGIYRDSEEFKRSPESEGYYRKEWNEIMETLHNYPSIVVWVPFNEAWGQFKTEEITRWTVAKDPSRLVNCASGGNFFPVGHIVDLHQYPNPAMPSPAVFGDKMIIVLGEYGGLGLPVQDHLWHKDNHWGYQSFKGAQELTDKYASFIPSLERLIKAGLSAAVYTQTTDVEAETNGMMTYDRKVIKIPVEQLHKMHEKLYNPALVSFPKKEGTSQL